MSTFRPDPEYDLAIVGAGFSGAMVAIHALSVARGPLTIALINKTADFGRGIAYGTLHRHRGRLERMAVTAAGRAAV